MRALIFHLKKRLLAYRELKHPSKFNSNNISERIARLTGADIVAYNDTTNLAKGIGIPEDELCFTCSTGDYSSLGITPIFKSRNEMKGQ